MLEKYALAPPLITSLSMFHDLLFAWTHEIKMWYETRLAGREYPYA